MLQLLLQYIELFLEVEAGAELAGVLNKVLAVLELMLREPVHRVRAEHSPDSVNHILRLFERVSDDESRLAALRIIALLGSTPESKLEICSREGFKQVLQLLLGKDERVSREVIRILKQLLERTPVPASRSEGFTTKIKGVFNGVVNLVYGFFPGEEGELTVTIEHETTAMPPREDVLRRALNLYDERKQKYWADERANSLEGTPVKGEERKVKEYIGRQGALSTIVEALHKVAMEEQLDIMETLGMLLTNSVRNQKEFRQLKGYAIISEVLDDIKDYAHNSNSESFLQSSFKIIQQIVQNGEDTKLVGNIQAFSLLLHIAATCPQERVIKQALGTLQSLIEQTWENVLCLYDEECLQYLEIALGRLAVPENYGTIGTWQVDLSFCEVTQANREQLFKQLDGIMRYSSFIMAHAHEKNGEILKVYSRVLARRPSHLLADLLETASCIVADLNTVNPGANALVRSIYLSAAPSVASAVSSIKGLVELAPEQVLRLLAHLVQYDTRYTETILSSQLIAFPSSGLCCDLVQDTDYMLMLHSLISTYPDLEWTYCHMLQTSHCWLDLSVLLKSLLDLGADELVARVMMMQEVSQVHSVKGSEIRARFIESLGYEWFLKPSLSSMQLLASCVRAEASLKSSLLAKFDLIRLAETFEPSTDLVDLILELSTEDGYLDAIGKEDAICRPCQTSSFLQTVLEPQNLIKTSPRHIDTKAAMPSPSEAELDSIKLLQDSLVSCLALLIPRASGEVQLYIFKRLGDLAKHYWNKRVLYRLQFSKLVLNLFNKIDDLSIEAAFGLLASVLSYSLTVEEADLLMSLVRDSPWQGRVINLLKYCLKLDIADRFYVLDRQTQDSPIITGVPKNGYTVVFWLKMRQTSAGASPIFTWVDRNRGLQLLQVAYKHNFPCLEKKNCSGILSPLKTRLPGLCRTLTASSFITVQAPSTAAFFPSPDDISQFEYELTKDWTHFCIVHSKNGLQVYINGQHCFSNKCSYFGAMKEKHSISGVLGDNSIQTLYAHVNCLEGCLEPQQVRSLYAAGVYATDLKSAGLEGRVVFSMPEDNQKISTRQALLVDRNPERVNRTSNPQPAFSQSAALPHEQDLGNLHCVLPFKEVLHEVAALPQFVSLLHQPVISQALELVAYFITKSPKNYAYFQELETWTLLVSLLQKYEEQVEPEALYLLFSPLTNVIDAHAKLKKLISLKVEEIPVIEPTHLEGLVVICDLLELLSPNKIGGLLECLANLLYVPQNVALFLSSDVNGLQVLMSLCSHYIYDERYRHLKFLTLTLFERITPSLAVSKEQLMIYLEFLSTQDVRQEEQAQTEIMEGLLCLLCIHVVTNSISLNDFKPEELLLVFNLLTSVSEHIRISALKFIGMMLWSSPKFEMWFKKTSGFDFVIKALMGQAHSMLTYNILFLISQNSLDRVNLFYPEDAGLLQTIINNSSIADKTLPPTQLKGEAKILSIDAIRVIVSLLKEEQQEATRLHVLAYIEKLIEADPENLKTLTDGNFLLWCTELLHPIKLFSLAATHSQAESDSKILELLNAICIYDLYRTPKQSRLASLLRRLIYDDDFEQKVLESILNSIQHSPNIDVTAAEAFFKNLISLLSKNELLTLNSTLAVQVMQLVNILAAANKPQTRAKMKDLGFFDLRDSLLMQLVRCEMPSVDLRNLLEADDTCFHSVASLIKFRESSVPLYITRLLLSCPGDPLQLALLRILKEAVCAFEENCKVLKKAIDHKVFLDFLFNYKNVEDGALRQCFKSLRQRPEDLEDEPLPANCSNHEFLAWLNTEERLRTLMVQVNKKLMPLDAEIKRNVLKLTEIRTTRINTNFETQLTEMTRVRKTIQPSETSLLSRVATGDRRCRDSVQLLQRQLSERVSTSVRTRNSL